MCNYLERGSDKTFNGYFVDLFVRVSNLVAITMYRKMGYSVYRRVLTYYDGEEDAFDMRKSLSRDKEGLSVIPLLAPIASKDLMASR